MPTNLQESFGKKYLVLDLEEPPAVAAARAYRRREEDPARAVRAAPGDHQRPRREGAEVSVDFDQLPEHWKPKIARAYADKLATVLAAVALQRPAQRQVVSQAIKAAFRDGMPTWIRPKDVEEAFDRLVSRMRRRGGVPAKKERK